MLEFPWLFCFVQFFDCADFCTSGRDINELMCRLGSTCAWNTGNGLGGCDCPDKCTDADQREDSIRDQFISTCPRNDDERGHPGPCAERLGEDWECGFLNYGAEFGSFISQFTENGSVNHLPDKAMQTFNGENIIDFESAAKDCLDSAVYNGDQTYTYSIDECFICFDGASFIFNSSNFRNQT